jgi:PadR family transcriptional regulator
MTIEVGLFGDIPEASLEGDEIPVNGNAIEQDFARGDFEEAGDHVHGGGFAGAVGAEIAGDLAGAGGERNLIDGNDAAETFGDAAKLKHRPYVAGYLSAMILQAIGAGYGYGFSIMEITGLPSGTVYPALRRLEREALIRSQWERQKADAARRPPRKYYKVTAAGKATLEASRKRYPLIARLIPEKESERV